MVDSEIRPVGSRGLMSVISQAIRNDRIVQVALIALGGVVAWYLFPFVSAESKVLLTNRVAPLVFLVLGIVAFQAGSESVPSRSERFFWSSLTLAFGFWIVVCLGRLVVSQRVIAVTLASDLLYAGLYLLLVLAVDSRPHLHSDWPFMSVERLLRWPAVALFVSGLLAYFVFLPAAANPGSYGTYLPSMYLFIALDAYLTVKLGMLLASAKSVRWRSLYLLMGCGTLFLMIDDVIEAMVWGELIDWSWGSVGNIVFVFPMIFFTLAARSRSYLGEGEGETEEPARDRFQSVAEQLVSYTVILPLIHFGGYFMGWLDPEVHPAREMLLFVWLILVGGLSGLQHSLLASRARQLASETSKTAEALRESEEQMRLVLERQAAEQARRLSDQKFARVFQASPDAMIIASVPQGSVIDANEPFLALAGREREALLGGPVAGLGLIPESVWKSVSSVMTPGGRIRNMEVTLDLPSGRRVECLISSERIELEGQDCVIVTARDITDRRKLESLRERLISELEAKNEELQRFTYTVSHDLKSPLITIRGFLGLLEKDALSGDADRLRGDIEQIVNASVQMQRLLDELLELSRIGRITHTPRNVSMNEIVEDCLSVLAGPISSRGVRVEVQQSLPVLYGDRVRLLQLLQNLVANAVKFMGDQQDPRIWIGAEEVDGEWICFVRDNGIGIDPQFSDRVFGLFERLNPAGDGTGIGLAIVHRIVDYHGGRVWVESEGEGTGSKFCFVLPNASELVSEISEH